MNFFAKLKSSLNFRRSKFTAPKFTAPKFTAPKFTERHEKTYIIPTLYGVGFATICLLLFGIGFASTNNAVYFLCFFMVALGSQSLIVTNRNTERVKVTHITAEDFFADEPSVIRLNVCNPMPEDLRSLEFSFSEKAKASVERIPAGQRQEILVPIASASPGFLKISHLSISSDFPYHFSRSWKKHYTNLNICVYPARKGIPQFARTAFSQRGLESQSLDDFKGHRVYQETDSPRSIDWKVSARLQKIMVKEYDPQSSRKITLRWEDCPQALDSEKKSQLSLWIDLAEKNNYDYALELPNQFLPLGHGAHHKSTCLRALI